MPIDTSLTFRPVHIAVLTVSDTRGLAEDRSGDTLVARLTALVEPSMRSAEDAAADRARAGESRAVEHVADLHPTQAVRAARRATKARK